MKRLLIIGLLFSNTCFAQFDMIDPNLIKSNGVPLLFTVNDFDGDGRNDIAYLSEGSFQLTILFQEIDKTFTEVVIYQASSMSLSGWGLSSGDLNKDGKSDIVAFDNGTKSIEKILVFKSKGRAFDLTKLNAPETYTIAKRINVIDWDNDSHLDILVLDLSEVLQFYKGNGLGQFTKLTITTFGFGHEMELGKLNNDLQLDLVKIKDNVITIYLSSGDSYTKSTFEVSNFVTDLAIGDLTQDGVNDILLINANGNSENLVLLKNNGVGLFNKEYISTPVALLEGLDISDFNNDGRQDILAGTFNNENGVTLFKNVGSLNFIKETINKNYSSLILQTEFEDLDNDSKPEIIAMSAGKRFDIFKIDNTTSQYSLNFTKITGFHANQGTVGDLNKDGIQDLVTSSLSNYTVSVQYGKSDLTFEKPIYFTGSGPVTAVGLSDVNKDTYLDIIYSCAFTSKSAAGVIKSDGGGGFLPPQPFDPHFSGINMVLSDLNNDGLTDIVNGNSLLIANSGGGYTQKVFNCPIGLMDFIVVDINNDSFKDIVITDYISIVYFLNDGNGNFPAYTTLKSSGTSYKLSVGDLNLDSKPDFIVGSSTPNEVIVYYGSNVGFSEVKLATSSYRAFNTIVEDFNNDTKPDFAVAHDDGAIDFFIQEENNQFLRSTYKSNGANFLLATDLNYDSKKDLLTYSLNGDPIGIFINDSVIEPNQEATNLTIINRTDKSAKLTLSKGDGNGRLLIIRESRFSEAIPSDGMFYFSNEITGLGTELNNKNFVLYTGPDQSIDIKGLNPDTDYILSIFEYNINQRNTIINYASSRVSIQFKTKKTQTISVTTIENKTIGDGPIQLSYGSSSSLPITIQVASGGAELSGNTLRLLEVGPVRLKFLQAGNDEFMEAEVEQFFCINPIKPIITSINTDLGKYTLTSSSASNNNWLRNDSPIVGATNKTYEPKLDGIYSVKVDYSGCFNISLPTINLITGIEPIPATSSLYPNPAYDKISINWPVDYPIINQIQIADAQGRMNDLIYEQTSEVVTLNISTLSNGLYNVLIRTSKGLVVKKIIKK